MRKYRGHTIVISKKVDSIIDKSHEQFNRYKRLYPAGFNIEYHISHTVDLGGNGTIYNVQFVITLGDTTLGYIFWYPLSPNRKCVYSVKVVDPDDQHRGYTKTRHFITIKDAINYAISLVENYNDKDK